MDLMQKALARVRAWPQERQNAAAELLLALDEMGPEPIEVDEDTLAAIDEALAQAERGETADPKHIEAFFSRFRP